MRLTLHTDYALRSLVYLGTVPDRLCSIREIAHAYDISENHLVKIIHRLGLAGFVKTTRGRKGGLRLARAPDQIRLGDVVRSTEEDMALVSCMQLSDETPLCALCRLMPDCHLKGVLNEALAAFMAVMDQRTLADVIQDFERTKLSENLIAPKLRLD
ncbi:RrF2 family transcriptional regulator [Acetobacter fallax]|uniref:Rrf2 family transcriptional regulator n=1 Tax=Acetobacter fallax TaxID=1737473 RepID=A0ABX0K5I3_9PROT|nr:Rrf2 family transcriptional regulator [Acetobacter fallax]NHO31645.1 Rrf2 family transcriptional regulator [Acetobacter fallax]NHO35204.1 Rrf2 family transcriptional regulator [Acetobacter fallax]